MAKETFLIYKSFYKPIAKMSNEQLGRLFKAIFEYNIKGGVEVDDDIEMAFNFFKNQFDVDESRYQKKIQINRLNGKKGGQQKAENKKGKQKKISESTECKQMLPNATERKQDLANLAYYEYDYEYNHYSNDIPPISPKGDETISVAEKEFEEFWELYDKKNNKNKVKAKFLKLSKADKEKIFATLQAYVDSTPDKTYRKDPLTYLNNQSWNDEIIQRNETRQSTASRPSDDHSQYRDYRRSYPTISDF